MHLFFYLFFLELVIAVTAYTNVAEYVFMPVRMRTERYLSKERLETYLILSLGIVFVFHAFKNPLTLEDIPEYVDAFAEAKHISFERIVNIGYESTKSETGFAIVIKVISELFSHSQVLFVITSAVIVSALYFSIERYSPIYWISVFVFIVDTFAQSLFILRAFLALSIYLFAFPAIINRKLLTYCLLALLAFSVHTTSVIFFPVYFLYGIKDWRYLILTTLILTIVLIVGFDFFLMFLIENVFQSYMYYIVNADNYEGASWKMPALLSAILLFRIGVMRRHFFEEGCNRLLSLVLILAVVIYVAGMGFGLTSRMAMYFTNMTFLILPNTLKYLRSSSLQFLVAVVYILFNGFFFFRNASDILWVNYSLIDI